MSEYLQIFGADTTPTQSGWTGTQAAGVALQRFASVIDTTNALGQATRDNTALNKKVIDFATRLQLWAKAIQTPLWQEIVFHAAPLSYLGVGLTKLLGIYKTDAEKSGVEYLNKVQAFEAELKTLCQEVQTGLGTSVAACNNPLPAPVIPAPEPSIVDAPWSMVKTAAVLGIVGLGVYFGGKALLAWAGSSTPARPAARRYRRA